jgi:hypothetical protein
MVERVHFRGNLFTELLPSNERLLWLRYSDVQASCHIILCLSQLILLHSISVHLLVLQADQLLFLRVAYEFQSTHKVIRTYEKQPSYNPAENLKRPLEDVSVGGRIILKWVLLL